MRFAKSVVFAHVYSGLQITNMPNATNKYYSMEQSQKIPTILEYVPVTHTVQSAAVAPVSR